jgi:hypothetical protein
VPVHLGAGGDLCSERRAGKRLRSESFLSSAKELLDEHGDEDTFDADADDRLDGGEPRLSGIERKRAEEAAPAAAGAANGSN